MRAVLVLLTVLWIVPAWADSQWSHNGSTMTLKEDGDRRVISYLTPRPSIPVQPGTVLFDGAAKGRSWSGDAHIFSRKCGAVAFKVRGGISDDGRSITLKGKRPKIDTTCKVVAYAPEVLRFERVDAADPGKAAPAVGSLPTDQAFQKQFAACKSDERSARERRVAACKAVLARNGLDVNTLSDVHAWLGDAILDTDYLNASRIEGRGTTPVEREILYQYDMSISLNNKNIIAHRQRIFLYTLIYAHTESEHDYERAMDAIDDAIRSINSSHSWSHRGILLYAHRNYSGALVAVSKAILIDPKGEYNYYFRAQILEKLGRTADALADYRTFLEMPESKSYGDDVKRAREAVKRLESQLKSGAAPKN